MRRRAGRPGTTPAPRRISLNFFQGIFNGRATGAPICLIIRNQNTRSGDYEQLKALMRPGHADYPAYIKYKGFNDYRGRAFFRTAHCAYYCRRQHSEDIMQKKRGIYICARLASAGKAESLPL